MQPVVMAPQGGPCLTRLPFVEDDSQSLAPRTYWEMLSTYFSPYWSFRTWSFLFIFVTFFCLIIPQFIFQHLNKTNKLFSYTNMPWVYMNPIEAKFINHWSIYKCFTTLFFHINYTHWVGNLLGITVTMFTMEYCWCPSILLAIIGGTATSAYAALSMNPILMGFSGVIACCVGLYFAMFLSNWSFLKTRFPDKITVWFINCFFIFILLFHQDARSTLVHFIAFFIGLVYGYAWWPKISQDGCERIISIVCKFASVIITILPFVLICLHPTTGIQSQFSQGMFGGTNPNPGFQNIMSPRFNMQPGTDSFAKLPGFQPFQQFQPLHPQMMQPNLMNSQFGHPQMNQWF